MFHRKFWTLGIATITLALLSIVGSAYADSYNNQVIQAGKVKIIRGSGRGTQIEMGRFQVDSELPRRQPSRGYWYNQYSHSKNSRTLKPFSSSTITTTTITNSGGSSSYQSNFSSHSSGDGHKAVTRVQGGITQFSLDLDD